MIPSTPSSFPLRSPAAAELPLPGARSALALLLAINLFNYIDRQVLAAVVPDIRRTFLGASASPGGFTTTVLNGAEHWLGFRPENALLGLLSMAFLVVYMLGAPVFTRLAERGSRWLVVGAAVAVWSLATGASGLAVTFGMLLLTRCLVGVGEAAYGPVAQAVLADLFPISRRGRILAWFNLAIPVGSALGFILGGSMARIWPETGWRWAFGVAVLPGLLLGMLAWRRGRRRGTTAPRPATGENGGRRALWRDYRELLRTPSYLLCTAGMCCSTFAIGGIGFWMVDYVQTVRGVGRQAAEIFGILLVVSGLTATLLGGWAGDRLRRRWGGSYFLVSGSAMLLGFPAFLLVLNRSIPFPLAWGLLFIACFCLFFNTGPANAILANVARPALRPAAFALNILLIHALGDVPSPLIIGLITDRMGGNMTFAFGCVSVLFILSGLCWLAGARFLARDTARAEREMPC
jgi:MFS family permease